MSPSEMDEEAYRFELSVDMYYAMDKLSEAERQVEAWAGSKPDRREWLKANATLKARKRLYDAAVARLKASRGSGYHVCEVDP